MRSRILVVARDLALRARLARLLKSHGYGVELAESGSKARRIAIKGIELAIVGPQGLEIEGNGLVDDLGARIGKILVLAAPSSRSEAHSDLIDPRDEAGLLTRVIDALRPAPDIETTTSVLSFGGFSADLGGRSLVEGGREVPLTRREFDLLREFVQRPGRVLSRDYLLNALAGRDAEIYDRSVDMLVVRLRRRLERDPKRPTLIVTVPGYGYKLAAKVTIGARAATTPSTAPGTPSPSIPSGDADTKSERRQITVLSAEIISFNGSALPPDPEELRPIVEIFRRQSAAIVTRHGGCMAQLTACEMLAYFGHPVAQEDAAERAVQAGLVLVQDRPESDPPIIRNFLIRVGIATGIVIADSTGEILGETPSEATRLRSMADGGQVVVAADTRRLAGRFFKYHDLQVEILRGIAGSAQASQVLGINRGISRFEARQEGDIGNLFNRRELGLSEVEGFANPVNARATEGLSVSESRFESVRSVRLTGFVGREDEIGLLIERWGLAQDGEGQVVLLSGEPGIGKSRILRELRARLEIHRAVSLRFHCSPYYVNSAFYPIIENFERASEFGHEESPEAKLDKLEALIVGQYGRPREDVRFIATMLSVPCEARYGFVAMTPQKFKDETFRALVDTVEAAARKQSTVMLFEDAHWADPTTLETMDLLIHRMSSISLLVVITHRPEFAPRWSHIMVT